MDISEFQDKLNGICILAAENGNTLTSVQVREYFSGQDLEKSQLLKILQYLKIKGITISDITIPDQTKEAVKKEVPGEPLTAEEEAYFKEYLAGLARPDSERSDEDLFQAMAGGDTLAHAELVQRYLASAADMAVQMNCREIPIPDLIQEANVSLLAALEMTEPAVKNDAWLRGEIRTGIRQAIEDQTQQKSADDCLVAKVQNLEAAVKELTEDEEEGAAKFSIGELAIILDMDVEEIRGVLRLTGDDK